MGVVVIPCGGNQECNPWMQGISRAGWEANAMDKALVSVHISIYCWDRPVAGW